MSLSLGSLLAQVVAVVAVVDLHLTGTGHGKSLGRCLVCLNLSHFSFPSFIVIDGRAMGFARLTLVLRSSAYIMVTAFAGS